CEWAAQAGHAARAAATSAGASPIVPDQTFSPVAGLVEVSISATAVRSTTSGRSSSCCCMLFQGFAHAANLINFAFNQLPVVVLGDGRPDRLDLFDVHRAWLRVRPIWVRSRFGPVVTFERVRQAAELFAGISLRAGVAAAAPVEEDSVDRLCARGERLDQRSGDLPIMVAGRDSEPPHHR